MRRGNLTSVVLVPTVIKGVNDDELGDIIRFAAYNNDLIRGVNFQPVSLVGGLKKQERERLRITIPDVLKGVEEQTHEEISVEDWRSIPYILPGLNFLEAIKGNPIPKFTNHPDCGMATYVYVDKHNDEIKFIPITRFVDVDSLMKDLGEFAQKISQSKIPTAKKYWELMKLLLNLLKEKYIIKENLPKGLKVKRDLLRLFLKPSYKSAGILHYDFLYLGTMHFMDWYNYNVQRVMRCNIHYLTPEGLVPFCTFNVFPDIYRDYFQRKYDIPLKEWESKYGKTPKHKRDRKKLESGEIYKRAYERFGALG
jgi:hypothetical protein